MEMKKPNLHNAEFLRSAVKESDFPHDPLPQIVFAGKSNVGKSSVINKLLNRKNFARVSAQPGKTIHINYFTIDKAMYLVDLPGYGYARVSKAEQQRWGALMETYFAMDLLTLGMPPALLDRVDALIARPHGIILVTGPTGSGKSTTLYAALSRLDAHERNIMTIEDPVEYELEGIGQTQVNAKVDMTFARGLRAILRQDPDVVLVGEIRDGETAQIAVQASLTGHLVLSTLHTNSALGAISRLQDMGVEPFLLSTSLLAVMSQRLVRQLCPHCRQPTQADADTARQMAVPVGARLWQPKGCPECNFIGYRGRTGIHELLLVDDRIRAAIHRGENEITLIQQLGPAWQTLRHAGRDKALAGITSWEEVMRVTEQQTTESV